LWSSDPKEPQNRPDNIVADLAEAWKWNDSGRELTFTLRHNIKWHDGNSFTANDVKCSWDLLTGKAKEKLRLNAREGWWTNLNEVSADNETQVTFHLKRSQPSFLALLASGLSPVYPCHVSPAMMRQHPIGTGPFRFIEFKPNQSIKLVRNPDYWKPDKPYLDAIEYTIIPSRSTAMLAFTAANFDLNFPYEITIAMFKEMRDRMPAVCETSARNVAMTLSIPEAAIRQSRTPSRDDAIPDRRAFIDILEKRGRCRHRPIARSGRPLGMPER
jgi:peptide/nickel transport system substrate-binding protein